MTAIAGVVAVAVFAEVTETETEIVVVIPNSHLTTPTQHVNVKYWKGLTSFPRRGWGRGGSDYIYWTRYFSVGDKSTNQVSILFDRRKKEKIPNADTDCKIEYARGRKEHSNYEMMERRIITKGSEVERLSGKEQLRAVLPSTSAWMHGTISLASIACRTPNKKEITRNNISPTRFVDAEAGSGGELSCACEL